MAERPKHPMPDFIRDSLEANGVMDDYNARPFYQRNDYIGWITRAKQESTRLKRLNQMIAELHTGGVYMKMDHQPSMKRNPH